MKLVRVYVYSPTENQPNLAVARLSNKENIYTVNQGWRPIEGRPFKLHLFKDCEMLQEATANSGILMDRSDMYV